MKLRVADLRRRERRLAAAAGLAALVTLAFLARFALHIVSWDREPDAALEPWMTIGYVARAQHVDRAALARAVGLDPELRARLTLAEIAARTGRPLAEVEADLLDAIAAERAERGG